jgi:hypothetical protein
MITMREVKDGEQLYTEDAVPERLLFTWDVAVIAGVLPETIRGYHSKAKARRRKRQPGRFPAPDEYVWRTMTKGDGRPLKVRTPTWRESRIKAWDTTERLGPRGRVRKAADGQADSAATGA